MDKRKSVDLVSVEALCGPTESIAPDLLIDGLELLGVVNHLPVGVIICSSARGQLIVQNEAAAVLFGRLAAGVTIRELAHFMGLTASDGAEISGDDFPMIKALAGEAQRDTPYILCSQNRPSRNVSISFGPLRRTTGEIFGGIVVVTDVTEAVAAEAALQKGEERYKGFIEQTSEAIWCFEVAEGIAIDTPEEEMIDRMFAEGRLVQCNDAMARMYRVGSARELLGLRLSEALDPAATRNREYLRLFIREGFRLTDAETNAQGRESGCRYYSNNVTGIVKNGRLIRAWGTQRDITQRKIADKERLNLLAKERKARNDSERDRLHLNALIDQIAEGIIVFDEYGAVTRANRNAHRIYGFSTEELCSTTFNDSLRARMMDDEGSPLAPGELAVPVALKEKRTVTRRFWYARPDGQKLSLLVTASPIFDPHQRLAGAVELTHDATEQQREHDRAQQADKLRGLGQLASGIAHNFNNALAAILGYTQLSIAKTKDADVDRYLRVVEQAAKDAARMVERIQNFARQSRKHSVGPVRIGDLVRDAIDITRPRWRDDAEAVGTRYQVGLDWQSDPDLMIEGEGSELREVFVKIILNAIDAMPEGGTLSISGSNDREAVVIRFTDTGIGMSEETRQRMFEPFFTTKGVRGLGMGLSESYRIVERHGGRIEVETKPAGGTTIAVALPLARTAARDERDPAGDLPAASCRVLVIDDEEFVRNVLLTILDTLGHEAVGVASAAEAYAIVEGRDFDVVFTDLAMPNTDGIAAAREIKHRKPATKIVLMSGYGSDLLTDRIGDRNYLDATISKPFNVVEISQTVRRLLAN